MYCSNCGVEIKDNANFCPNCGMKFSEDSETSKQSNPSKSGTSFWTLLFIAFIVGAVIGIINNFSSNSASTDVSKPTSPIDTPKPFSAIEKPSNYAPTITPAETTIQAQNQAPIEIDWTPPTVPNDLDRALSDYQWRQSLVTEQTTRLDMYYASKSGTKMNRDEFKGWLDDLKGQTIEFVKRNKDAMYSGDNYANLINANINKLDYNNAVLEIERVNKNKDIMANDINNAINNFNQNVQIYNNWGK